MKFGMGLQLVLVATGGAVGAALRYLAGVLIPVGFGFPWATLAVNVIGCFSIGLIVGYFENELWYQNWGRYLIVIGILGGLTTFSAFSYEIIDLGNNDRWSLAASYALISILGSLVAAVLGYKLANQLVG